MGHYIFSKGIINIKKIKYEFKRHITEHNRFCN